MKKLPLIIALLVSSVSSAALAAPKGEAPRRMKAPVSFRAERIRATPRAMTREAGQTCMRRALEQGRGSVTICSSSKR